MKNILLYTGIFISHCLPIVSTAADLSEIPDKTPEVMNFHVSYYELGENGKRKIISQDDHKGNKSVNKLLKDGYTLKYFDMKCSFKFRRHRDYPLNSKGEPSGPYYGSSLRITCKKGHFYLKGGVECNKFQGREGSLVHESEAIVFGDNDIKREAFIELSCSR